MDFLREILHPLPLYSQLSARNAFILERSDSETVYKLSCHNIIMWLTSGSVVLTLCYVFNLSLVFEVFGIVCDDITWRHVGHIKRYSRLMMIFFLLFFSSEFFLVSYHINLQLVGFLAFCLLSRILVYIMLNITLFKSAACIDRACFRQLPCAIYFLFPMFI